MSDVKTAEKLKVCLAIPTYNREEILIRTLKTAFALSPAPLEILVVDQTQVHEKGTALFLEEAERLGRIRLIRQDAPSLTLARNRAIAETRSDIIVFIDDDVELPGNFIEKHSGNYADKNVQAVAGGVDQEHQPRYPKPPRGGNWPRLLDYKYFSVYTQTRTEGVGTLMGCNHSARVEILRRLGGYDSQYLGSALFEDTDMALRIWESGGKIVFDPEARLRHLAAPTGGCRIHSAQKANPEWWVPFNRHYFAFRHLFPTWEFWWSVFAKDFRQTVLRKANLARPWRIPRTFFAYFYSLTRAWVMALKWKNNKTQKART